MMNAVQMLVRHWAFRCIQSLLLVATLAIVAIPAAASPYAETGDIQLRHDLEYLADRGLVSVPLTTWPMSWADVISAVESVDRTQIEDPATLNLLRRLDARVANGLVWQVVESSFSIGANEKLNELRIFDDRPEGSVELEGRIEYTGKSFVANLQVGLVDDSQDSESVRLDGSYIGYIFKNVAITAGSQDAWWGPGHAGSLILSNNARPVPGITVRRNVATAFESPWLSWLGRWTALAFAGRLESDRGVSQPYLLGARVAIKPFRSLELGVSRSAQWGGEGRPESFSSLVDLVIGRDNAGEGVSREEEPGNQMAGFDARWSLGRFGVPVSLYGQLIGEDEAGGFPSRYLGMGGVSTSFAVPQRLSTVRLNLEYSDTTCQFNESSPRFNCAYNNDLYPSGYRFRGRAIGHSTDADSRQLALVTTLNSADRKSWQATLRSGRLNRGGPLDPAHSLANSRVDYIDIDVGHSRPFRGGNLKIGIGFTDSDFVATSQSSRDTRFYLRWESKLR